VFQIKAEDIFPQKTVTPNSRVQRIIWTLKSGKQQFGALRGQE